MGTMDTLSHKAQRAAFGVALDAALKRIEKDTSKGLLDVLEADTVSGVGSSMGTATLLHAAMSEVWEGKPVPADGGVRARNQQRMYVDRVTGRSPAPPLPRPTTRPRRTAAR